jgi:hypothetical protein
LQLGDLVWFYFVQPVQDIRYTIKLLFPYAYFGTYSTSHIPGPYDDALLHIIQRFQTRVSYDAAAAAEASKEIVERLEAGETIAPPEWCEKKKEGE